MPLAVRRVLSLFEPADVPALRQRSSEVRAYGKATQALIDDLLDTLADRSDSGIAIAAPQIGAGRRVVVACLEKYEEPLVLVNPRLIDATGELTDFDGCLSIPGVYADTRRAQRVHVEACDRHGEPLSFDLEDFDARIVQHEVDHLDGVLFIDRLDDLAHLYRVVQAPEGDEPVRAPLAAETLERIRDQVRDLPPFALRWH